MEIQFKSEFFKRIFDSEVFTDEMANYNILSIYKDLNPNLLLSKEMLDDYIMVLENSPNIENITFSELPAKIIKTFLSKGIKGKALYILNTELISELFAEVDEKVLENLEELYITGCTSSEEEKTQILSVDKFKNLKSINFINSEGLDVNDFLSKLPQKEIVEKITLSEPLPSPDIIKSFTGIKNIEIFNVKNAEALRNFLNSISLESVEELKIGSCDCGALSEEIATRLKNVKKLEFFSNSNIEYSNFLENIHSKDLKHVEIVNKEDNPKQFDISKLKKFNLNTLYLANLELDFEELGEVLKSNGILQELRLHGCGVENLDFLKESDILKIIISQKELDFSILTTELAEKLKDITLRKNSTNEVVQTKTINHGNEAIPLLSTLIFNVEDTTLEQIEHLAKNKNNLENTCIRLTSKDVTRIQDFVEKYGYKMDFGYILGMSDFSLLDENNLQKLNKEKRIRSIKAMDVTCNDAMTPDRFSYRPEQFIELKEIIGNITKDIDPDMSQLEKFMIVYRRLGSVIKYDYGIIGVNKYSQYAKDNVDNSRNMINGLIRNTCVCAGYADILYNCLREVGIEAYKVTGTSGTDWHQWNKVKIDGVLYNVDLTWDAENLADNCLLDLKNCLVSDTFFGLTHKGVFGNSEKCERSISRKAKREALRKALEIDGIEPKTLFGKALDELREMDILEELKKAYESFKESWRVEILPELKRLFSKEKALPPPIEKTNLDESLKEKVEETKEGETNPWVVEEEIKNKVNKISHESVNPIKNLNIIDKEVSDE